MDHRQLGFLVALASERHFGRAARVCHVTQPTLSARLKQLEEELGTALVIRGHRFEGFTPEGERVLTHARRILAELDELKGDLAPGAVLTGRLTLGVVPSALGAVGDFLPRLREAYPQLSLRLRELSTSSLAQGLEDGELDLAVGYPAAPAMSSFACRPLYQEHSALIASREHFSLPTAPEWGCLRDYPLVLLTPEMQQRRRLNQQFERLGLRPSPLLEANSIAALGVMLEAGLGVSVLAEGLADARLGKNLVAQRLPGDGETVGLLWRAGQQRSRRLSAVLELLR
ncbi:LysR family transcriptional regulator [Cobetia sp. L2A1]|uniref:LysR family transcriptional regulator n=1 Tax=Cobetia sp. L2A1 TaxID=2686360 RepID=UPI00131D2A94|nr:LysR family transcriptional regulator [Cobetia sp. L2A1]